MPRSRSDPIRVVVVDDSPTVQQLLVAILQSAGDIQVIGVGSNGEDAVRLTKRVRPDVLAMDIRMPKMDGLEATRQIMREMPTPIVIVTGDLMRSDSDITFEALRAGALTVVRSPGLADPEGCQRVIQAVRLMAEVPVVHHWGRDKQQPGPPATARPPLAGPQAREGLELEGAPTSANVGAGFPRPSGAQPQEPCPPRKSFGTLPRKSFGIPQMVGMAASTGGPGALATVLRQLPANFPAPILVVQHVARGFVQGLAEWLDGQTPLHVALANHGDTPQPGSVLIAPDDYHLQVNAQGIVELCKEPPYKKLRPSANYLFRSLAQAYGPRAVGVILTGMGDDGAEGLEALHRAGGLTIAQDEASCVVYGMPCQAVARRAVDQVLSLDQIALGLRHLATRQRRQRETL